MRETEVITTGSQETEFIAFCSEDIVSSNLHNTFSLKSDLFIFHLCVYLCVRTRVPCSRRFSKRTLDLSELPDVDAGMDPLNHLVLKGPDPLLIHHVGKQVFNTGTFERKST